MHEAAQSGPRFHHQPEAQHPKIVSYPQVRPADYPIFTGKSGKQWSLRVKDRRIAKIIRACQELLGQELLQYVDEEGNCQDVTSSDVNDYLKEITGTDITAKDFRTWAGTVLAAMALNELESFDSAAQAKRSWPVLRWPRLRRGFFVLPMPQWNFCMNVMVSSIFAVPSRVILGTNPFPNGVVPFICKRAVPLFFQERICNSFL